MVQAMLRFNKQCFVKAKIQYLWAVLQIRYVFKASARMNNKSVKLGKLLTSSKLVPER